MINVELNLYLEQSHLQAIPNTYYEQFYQL